MRLTHTLHLGALFVAASAFFWALTAFVGALFVVAFLAGLTGGILLMLGRGVPATALGPLRMAAGALIGVHVILILLFLLATPYNLGKDPSTGFNLEPAEWIMAAMDFYVTSLLVLLIAITLPLAVLTVSPGTLERVLGAVGAGAVILVIVLGLLGIGIVDDGYGMFMNALFFLGFLTIAVATILPPWQANHPPWTDEAVEETPSTKAA